LFSQDANTKDHFKFFTVKAASEDKCLAHAIVIVSGESVHFTIFCKGAIQFAK